MRPVFASRLTVADAASALFMAAVAAAAGATGIGLLLFPELGALANDILRRPRGAWASAPVMLVLTPLATGAVGVALARHLPFGLLSVGLDVGASIALIQWMRSPIAPAISAGLLPLVLGTTSAGYPLAISAGTVTLALLGAARRRFATGAARRDARDRIDDLMEQPAGHAAWWLPFVLVLGALTALAQWSGQRFVLFPPLVVIGFEMFAHPRVCPWARRAWRLPLACTLAAAGGVVLVGWLGHGALAAAAAMLVGTTVLRALDLQAPPVLAVGLLPLVMGVADARFVGAVLVGTVAVTGTFLGWEAALRTRQGVNRSRSRIRRGP
ncbi:MAG: hypothetical protein KGI42_12495 [Xanthomonadaceae bacterium]|nr:hypothetical protein [Xanthomonadaceae bacterium]